MMLYPKDAIALNTQEDLQGVISAMLRQEEDYLCRDCSECSCYEIIEVASRTRIATWLFQVVDCTQLQRETAAVSMSYLDRFMCTSSPSAIKATQDRKMYQLAALTALYIATKLLEPFVMDASIVSKLSRGLYSKEEIIAMESEILVALNWKVNGPTPLQFVNYLLELISVRDKELHEHSIFQTELAVGDFTLISFRQSIIAVAAILNSLENLPKQSIPPNERVRYAEIISMAINIDISSPLVNNVRVRLLESYSKSKGSTFPRMGKPSMDESTHELNDKITTSINESPNSVKSDKPVELE